MTDDVSSSSKRRNIGLCRPGDGYRAMVLHLGALMGAHGAGVGGVVG